MKKERYFKNMNVFKDTNMQVCQVNKQHVTQLFVPIGSTMKPNSSSAFTGFSQCCSPQAELTMLWSQTFVVSQGGSEGWLVGSQSGGEDCTDT